MKKQIIAGITATMTVAGNAVTLVHAENKADNTAPISQETESPLSTEQQQALAEATTAETKLNDAKTQMTTAEENTKQADKTVTETVQKHTDAMRNTAIADEAALKDVNAKKEEATKAQQELDKADKVVLCQVLEQLKCPFFMLLSMQQPQQFHCVLLCYSLSSHSTLPRIHLATDIHNGNGFSPYCRSLLYS